MAPRSAAAMVASFDSNARRGAGTHKRYVRNHPETVGKHPVGKYILQTG